MTADHRPQACAEVAGDLPELALGVLSGRERARALAHLEQCPACTAELDQLTVVADEVLTLAPEAEPPMGFEVALFERMGLPVAEGSAGTGGAAPPVPRATAAGARGRRRGRIRQLRHWRPVAAAAAVVAVALAFGGGWLASGQQSGGGAGGTGEAVGAYQHMVTAAFTSGGHSVGQVVMAPGSPTWMLVAVHGLGGARWVRCDVTTTAGTTRSVGGFDLTDGSGSWGVPLHVGADDVRSARLVDAQGGVLARAVLAT